MTTPTRHTRATPILFVAIWATGFVVARLVATHTDPLTFLAWRFALTAAAFAAWALAVHAPWPRGPRAWRNALVTGVLMQGIYLGGIFWSVHHGLPAGLSALITGLQPLLTAILSGWLLHEPVAPRRWLGIATGFAGAALVLAPQLHGIPTLGPGALAPLAASFLATIAITLGTIWQKRTGAALHLATNGAVQFIGATALLAPLAYLTEPGRIDNTWQVWLGMAWGVLALSLGAATLLLILLRRAAVAGVASLFYLVPPVVALIAYLAFDDRLTPLQLAGMALAILGVYLARTTPNPPPGTTGTAR